MEEHHSHYGPQLMWVGSQVWDRLSSSQRMVIHIQPEMVFLEMSMKTFGSVYAVFLGSHRVH